MNIYLITACIVDGEHEHTDHALLCAKDQEQLDKLLEEVFAEEEVTDEDEDAKGYFSYGDGLTAAKHKGTRLVTIEEAAILERLNVVHFYNEDDAIRNAIDLINESIEATYGNRL